MIKILFLIHDLGPGGAEKVLVNLVNNMDPEKFDITVMALFGGGVNEQFLKPHVRYISCFKHMIRGNSHLMKLMTPKQLHKWLINDEYDIEVSYLEGPSARIIGGCPNKNTKIITWIHCLPDRKNLTTGFRSYREAKKTYSCFDKVICVSKTALDNYNIIFSTANNAMVLYNTNDSAAILNMSSEPITENWFSEGIRLIAVGRLIPVKAFDRLIRIHKKLREDGYNIHSYILGDGVLRPKLEKLSNDFAVSESISFLGYKTNVCKYIANSDLFICSSLSEGFSTAATEALIVGTPICTVDVSGMKEMLGENNEYGIVTENDEESLYQGIKALLDDPMLLKQYKIRAKSRGKKFQTKETVETVETMIIKLLEIKQ